MGGMKYTLPRPTSLLLLALLLAISCEGRTQLTSPVVRVDLRDKLPPHLQRLVSRQDDSYPCQMAVTLEQGGASQELVVVWKVLQDGPDRHLTAVAVEARAPTSGGTDPTASAAVGTLASEKGAKGLVQMVPLTLQWQAAIGCNKVSAIQEVQLRSDHESCKKPVAPEGLLKPVQ